MSTAKRQHYTTLIFRWWAIVYWRLHYLFAVSCSLLACLLVSLDWPTNSHPSNLHRLASKSCIINHWSDFITDNNDMEKKGCFTAVTAATHIHRSNSSLRKRMLKWMVCFIYGVVTCKHVGRRKGASKKLAAFECSTLPAHNHHHGTFRTRFDNNSFLASLALAGICGRECRRRSLHTASILIKRCRLI